MMTDDILMARIYLSEADHGRRKALMQEIFGLLRDKHAVQGVTVFRGVAEFGASGEVHANDLLRLTVDLPEVIEFFDKPEVVEAAIALIDGLVPGGHMVTWPGKRYGTTPLPLKKPDA